MKENLFLTCVWEGARLRVKESGIADPDGEIQRCLYNQGILYEAKKLKGRPMTELYKKTPFVRHTGWIADRQSHRVFKKAV